MEAKTPEHPEIRQLLPHLCVLGLFVFIIVVLKMDTYHLRLWDESMFAVNTYEMLRNGNYFSLYFNGAPDLINTKPPFTVWLQLICVKMFGYNELAVRLPSVLAASASVFLLFTFMFRRFGYFVAWTGALVLLTSMGYVGFHTARTGDSDALLSFFLLCTNLYFLRFILEGEKRFIFWFFVFLTLAFYTKIYAALFFVPAYFLILLLHKKFVFALTTKAFWLGLLLFISGSVAIIYLRELGSPGYFQKSIMYDLGKMSNSFESHSGNWDYYLEHLNFSRFSFWFIPALIGLVFILTGKTSQNEKLFIEVAWMAVLYLVVISFASTKLFWYDMPVIPLLAMLAGFGLYKAAAGQFDTATVNGHTLTLMLVVFALPLWIMFNKSQANPIPAEEQKKEAAEMFIFKKSAQGKNLDGVKVLYHGWVGSLLFYKYKLAEEGQTIELTTSIDFKSNDRVLVSNDSLFSQIKTRYGYKLLDRQNNARLIEIQ